MLPQLSLACNQSLNCTKWGVEHFIASLLTQRKVALCSAGDHLMANGMKFKVTSSIEFAVSFFSESIVKSNPNQIKASQGGSAPGFFLCMNARRHLYKLWCEDPVG